MLKKDTPQSHFSSDTTWQSQLGWTYLIGIFAFSLLSFHRDLLDFTLLPRYLCASLVFFIITLIIGYKSLTPKNEISWPRIDWPTGLLFGYCLWSSLSVLWATNFSEAIFESQKVVLGFAAFYYCRWFQLNDTDFVPRLLKALIVICILALMIVLWQVFQIGDVTENAQYSITGISGHKNLFSIFCFLLLGFLTLAYSRLEKNWRRLALLLGLSILVILLFLKTRSVYLGLIVVAAVWIFRRGLQFFQPKQASLITKATIVLCLLGFFAVVYLWLTNQLIPLLQASRIDELWQSDTGYERLTLWEKTACVIRQSPFWGVGAGNWQINYPNCSVHGLYSVELDSTTFQRPHNDWLWVWAEVGLMGLFFYAGFFLTILIRAGRSLIKADSESSRSMALTQFAILLGFMIIACFSFPKERIEIILLLYTFMGLYHYSPVQTYRSLALNKFISLVLIVSTSLSLYIGVNRVKGEKNMRKVLVSKQQQKWSDMIETSNLALSRWYTIDPTSIPIHWYRGTAHFIQGRTETAMEDFFMAKKYAPYNQHIHNDLGTCFQKMGDGEQALKYYKESIRISPLFDDPRVNIGVSYYNLGQYEEALDWINSIRDHDLKMKYRKIISSKMTPSQ